MLLALVCLDVSTSMAEVVEVGRSEVSRYAVVDGAADAEPAATGELVQGEAAGISVRVEGRPEPLAMSLAQAESVHQLLGHMLAVGADPASGPGDPPAAEETHSPKRAYLGLNLAGVSYYSRAWVFTDLMRQSDAWRKDSTGYIFKAGLAPPGQYTALWMGSGSVRFAGDASGRQTGSNSAAVVIKSGQEGINLQKVGEVSSVSLMRDEYDVRTSAFNPVYLKRLEPVQVLRFMDWGQINNSKLTRWGERPLKSLQTQAGRQGVAIEYMLDLSNELKADPWFCVPHGADDRYIRQFAELVRDRLHPGAKVYVEYSNEVWNSQFKQHDYIKARADGENQSDAFFDAWAERCRNTFGIWSEVFGDQAGDRLVRVAAVHLQNPWSGKQLVSRLNGEFDAISPAAYFGVTHKQARKLHAGSTTDQLLDLCEENIRGDNRDWYDTYGELARTWSGKLGRPIRLVAYEAGQHLTAHGNDKLTYYDTLINAQDHPRIYGLYLLNMRLFENAGGDLIVAYNDVSRPGRHGSWGHLAYQEQRLEEAPKFRALLDYPSIHTQDND